MKSDYLILGTFFLAIISLSGCSTHVRYGNDTAYHPEQSVRYTFQSSMEKTWDAAVNAVLESGTIASMDKENGFIVTDRIESGRGGMNLPSYALSSRIYTFSYLLKLIDENNGETRVDIEVSLFQEYDRELPEEKANTIEIKKNLGERLYEKICTDLFPSGNGYCYKDSPAIGPMDKSSKKPAQSTGKHFDAKLQSAQQELTRAGYDPGPADGLMGRMTREALNSFQKDNDLAITWSLNDATFKLLTQSPRPETYKPPAKKVKVISVKSAPAKTPEKTRANQIPEKIALPPLEKINAVPVVVPPISAVSVKPASGYITTDDTDLLRDQDLFGSEILDTIPADTPLDVLSKSGEYYKVNYKGKEGYIYLEFVRKVQ
ncbi:MAG: peptidoglycan-binding protein [Deltaproteobacteria bacterium]|nr:peptidoglycan-binding protein [Deltaproteobacteria bacterium]